MGVHFVADPGHHQWAAQGNDQVLTSQLNNPLDQRTASSTKTYISTHTQGETLNAQTLGVIHLYGSTGNDTLIAAASGSWMVGGGGSNHYRGGAGDDVFVISSQDQQANIDGAGGTNTAIFLDDKPITLNMAQANIHIAHGGKGNATIISGGRTGVYIKGGEGYNTLIGGAGTDVIVGGTGYNLIIGGTGKSVMYGGANGNTIYGAADESIIHLGGGTSQVVAGDRNDVIKVGTGTATVDGGGGINILELQGSYADYQIDKINNAQGAQFRITDKMRERNGTVTFKNIQKLNFSDISAIDLTSPNAMPVTDMLRVNATGHAFNRQQAQLISAAQLLANDHILNSQGKLRISALSDVVGGVATLTSSGDILFTPHAQFNGMMRFKYSVTDAAGNAAITVQNLASGQTAPMRAQVILLTPELPNDPLVAQQWYLNDTHILPVWKEGYSGKGIRIGQFEPGGEFAVGSEVLDYQHPDLAANIDEAWLRTHQTAGTLPTRFSNHATMVAGIMVAANNDSGAVGVAYNAKIAGYYLANNGSDASSLSHISQYDIANHSWGFAQDFAVTNLPEGSVNTHSAMLATTQYAAGNGRSGLGTVMVTAGGNKRAQGGSAQGSMMNNSRFTIQVGASHTPGDLSTLRSSSAPFSNPGASLLISAPGNHVTTTSQIVKTDQGSIFGNQHSVIDGTSFATPIVSSIIALILEANPQLGYRDVQAILAACARKISDTQTQWNDNGAKNWNGGGMHASHDYGFGHIDAYAALRLAQTWTGKSTAENEFFYHAQSGPLNHSVSATQAFSTSLRLQNGVQVEHMEVDLDLSYADFKDVIVKLISPKGTQSILLNRPGQIPSEPAIGEKNDVAHINAGTLRYTFMSTHHWGERSEGEWTLQVSDATNGTPLTLNSWRIRAYGNKLSPDDTYIYTDEYKTLVAAQPHRAVLNDANNGIAGGRNTLNAAAVRGDTTINLNTGAANLGGTALSIVQPHTIHNLISGEGNDTLIAGPDNAVLDGGHGYNTLTGGAGKDIFVVRYRQQGCDTLTNFNAPYGEVIHLVGFSGKKYTDLTIQQEGKDTRVHCGTQQSIVLKNTVAANLNAQQFIFQDHLTLPEAYLNSASKVSTLPSGQGVINLNGGGTGISLTTENGQMVFKLTGTIYQRDNNFATNYFVIKAQTAGTKNYSNVLRGYKPGIDKIDLTQLGITHFNELKLEQTNRATVNGIATIRGTQIKSLIARNNMYGVDLSYLDSIDPAQLSERDFIFAQATPEQAGAIPSPIATISQPPAGTITPPQKVNTPTLFPEEKPSVITPSSPPNIPPPPGGIRPRLLLQGDDNDNNLKATRLSGDTTLKGLGGNDRLQGGSGNDLLDGRAGDDQMNGYLGSDTYLFYRGAGKDTIYEYTNPVGDTDVLAIIDPSISAEQLWFKKENTHLVMQLIGTQDRMMIESWIYWDQPLKNLNSPMEKLY
ncbi:MAG: S8 family serine peptidase [Ottowia sp.]|nr:S8 family serine peptidase [Ottowia sp.]